MTEPNTTLGRYVIQAELGKGGFATVFRALDTSLNREVALKILHPQLLADRTFVDRFRKEARTLASLRHAHIVTIYEVSEAEGRVFIAMELAHGSSLAQAIADRKHLPWTETLAILKPVTEALDYAHGQGVIHRDLKPANILLDSERGPLLTDFGFARLMGDSSMSMSLSGGILGTPAYIAPEVWELDTATAAADIYALGCIAYEMVTGEVLFSGKTPMQSMRAHDRGPQFNVAWPGDAPQGIDRTLQVALARKPDARYPSASALWHALNDLEANAQAAREQAERQAIADQWKVEVDAAMTDHEWSAAKMAVGRWLAITPEDAEAIAARSEIERQIEQEAREAGKKQEAEAARKAEEERQRLAAEEKKQQEAASQAAADAKAKQAAEEQERQRQAILAAQEKVQREAEAAAIAAQEKTKREAAERAQQAAAEKARLAEAEQARPIETPNIAQQEPNEKSKTSPWLFIVGAIVIVTIIAVVASGGGARPATVVEPPTQTPAYPTEQILQESTQICVIAFDDLNGNGVREADEPMLAGVGFTLTDANGVRGSYKSNGNSEPYCFGNLAAGAYTVQARSTSGLDVTTPSQWAINMANGAQFDVMYGAHQGTSGEMPPTVALSATSPAPTLAATPTNTPRPTETPTPTLTPTIRRPTRIPSTPTATPPPPCPKDYFWNPAMNRCQSSGGGGPSSPPIYP